MKATIELPDELYGQITRAATLEGRPIDEVVSDALRSVLRKEAPRRTGHRLVEPPIKVSPENEIPALTNQQIDEIFLAEEFPN